ncbi:MAG: radical SAM protein [Alphaproteobacteria bacterium]|nr:radical SAM protein [Alphaproteobacteria bacterium]
MIRDARLLVGFAPRQPDRLDRFIPTSLRPPTLEQILAVAREAPPAGAWTLWGGEPTLRPDLPRLIEGLAALGAPNLGLHTDGLALAAPGVARTLRDAGLQRARVDLHAMSASSRFAAHDWLVGRKGAGRAAVEGIRQARRAGLKVEVELVVTRPSRPLLPESVALIAQLGVDRFRLRRLFLQGAARAQWVTLSPRLGLMAESLRGAVQTAAEARRPLTLHGFPACLLPEEAHRVVTGAQEPVLTPSHRFRHRFQTPVAADFCPTCPRGEACDGAPSDYVYAFGARELPQAPPPDRHTAALELVAPLAHACVDCHGDLQEGHTPSRHARKELVRLATEGVDVLEITGMGALDHPDLVGILKDAVAAGFAAIEVSGDGAALAERPRSELRGLRRLRPVDRIDLALYGPDAARHDAHCGRPGAFAATLLALEALRALTRAQVGLYGVLHHGRDLADWAVAWETLPGPPAFRLLPEGGDLQPIAEAVPPSLRSALAPLLAHCLGGAGAVPGTTAPHPRGANRRTAFAPCECTPKLSGCPGLALGYLHLGHNPDRA